MLRNLVLLILVISGCMILVNGIGEGTLGLALIFASGILLVCWPGKKPHGEYYNAWYDI